MLGTLRLLLAMTVATSHLGLAPFGFQSGVAAVACFYAISGYAMTGLLQARPSSPAAFCRDRLLRLAPQDHCRLPLGLAGLSPGWRYSFLQAVPLTPLAIIADATLLPLAVVATLSAFAGWLSFRLAERPVTRLQHRLR